MSPCLVCCVGVHFDSSNAKAVGIKCIVILSVLIVIRSM